MNGKTKRIRMKAPMRLAPLALASAVAACGPETAQQSDADLTSLTGTPRTLTFEGYVYVPDGSPEAQELRAVRAQTQSAFGALRTANIGAADRELKQVDPTTFRRESLDVVDGATGQPTGKKLTRVAYTYSTTAIVPNTQANRSTASLAVLQGNYATSADRILAECTENTEHDRDFRSSIWYVFNPSLENCRRAMANEQQAIDKARAVAVAGTITTVEAARLYLPLTMQLLPSSETTKITYPEYDRLFSGGVAKDRLVVGFVAGFAADWAAGEKVEPIDDRRWPIWLEALDQVFRDRPTWRLVRVEPDEGVTAEDFQALLDWHAGRTAAPARAVQEALAAKLVQHWVTLEAPVQVSVGGGSSKPFTLAIQTYFGAGSDQAPYKRAIKTSDVVAYAGHSYIGYGPLDPRNFSPSDFPASYQLFFINGCVSFNYYDRDYFNIKPGGSKMLDTITNGVETPQYGSGEGMGRFLSLLLSGKNAHYPDLLRAAQFDYRVAALGRDGLRVVDGEQDNAFDPGTKSVSVE